MSKGLKPNIEVGQTVEIFGVQARVIELVPAHDYAWQVLLSSVSGGGEAEVWKIEVPTDYRTDDNHYAWEDDEVLGPCGCTDYHMADCPTRTGGTGLTMEDAHSRISDPDYDPYYDEEN